MRLNSLLARTCLPVSKGLLPCLHRSASRVISIVSIYISSFRRIMRMPFRADFCELCPLADEIPRARIIYNMYGEEKCAVGGKKALHFLPVPGNVVPLHPQTRGDRLFRDGRDLVALPWGARSLRDLHRQEIVVQETSTSEPSISFHKDRDKKQSGSCVIGKTDSGSAFFLSAQAVSGECGFPTDILR